MCASVDTLVCADADLSALYTYKDGGLSAYYYFHADTGFSVYFVDVSRICYLTAVSSSCVRFINIMNKMTLGLITLIICYLFETHASTSRQMVFTNILFVLRCFTLT